MTRLQRESGRLQRQEEELAREQQRLQLQGRAASEREKQQQAALKVREKEP